MSPNPREQQDSSGPWSRLRSRTPSSGQCISLAFALLMATSLFAMVPGAATAMVGTDDAGSDGVLNDGTVEDLNLNMNTVQSAGGENGTVYVGSDDSNLYALDASTGAEEWNYSTGGTIDPSPTVADGTVYVGSDDNNLYALNASTGEKEWNYSAGSYIQSSPTIVDETVYVGSDDNTLYAVNASTGAEEWSYATGSDTDTSPTVANGTVYVGSWDDTLHAVNASTGAEEWTYLMGNSIHSSPTFADGTVYIGSDDNNLYAVDASTGEEEWNYSTGNNIRMSPTVADGTVYVGSGDSNLYALDASTGAEEWNYSAEKYIYSSPTIADGTVYVGSGDSNLYAVDASTGEKEWNYSSGGYIQSSPTFADGTVYVGSSDNNLHALNASTGEKEWNYSAGNNIYSSPTFVSSGSSTSDGSRVTLGTLGHVGDRDTTDPISGTVVDQYGNPVEDATVEAYALREPAHPEINTSLEDAQANGSDLDEEQLREEIADLEENMSDPLPDEWKTQDFTLESHTDVDGTYLLAHSQDDWPDESQTTWGDGIDDPRLQFDSGETIRLSLWDTSSAGGGGIIDTVIPDTDNPLNDEYPGEVRGKGAIVVERLDINGDDTSVETYTADTIYHRETGAFGNDIISGDYVGYGVEIERPPGIYHVYPRVNDNENTDYQELKPEAGYYIMVGSESEVKESIIEPYKEEKQQLEDQYGENLTTHISELNEDIDELEDKKRQIYELLENVNNHTGEPDMVRKTATTNANGEWTINVPDNTVMVSASAYDTPGSYEIDPTDPQLATIREQIQTADDYDNVDFSIGTSIQPVRAEPPAEDVRIEMQRFDMSQFVNDTGKWEEFWLDYLDGLDNETLGKLEAVAEQPLEEMTKEDLADRFVEFAHLVDGDPETWEEYLNESQITDLYDEYALDDGELTREQLQDMLENEQLRSDELETEIQNLQTQLENKETVVIEEVTKEVTEVVENGTALEHLSMEYPIDSEIETATVEVVWSDGTIDHMDEQYWSVEEGGILGTNAVVVESYPIEEKADGRAMANVRVQAATVDDEIARGSEPVENPAFGGQIPGVDAVDFETLRPGADERVSFALRPEAESGFGSLSSVDVYGPTGEQINATVGNSDRASFRTNGQGIHHIRATYTNVGGNEFVMSVPIRAGTSSVSDGPAVQVRETTTGQVALAGADLESARIDTSGGTVSVEAIVPGGESISSLDVHPGRLGDGDEHEFDIRVLEGADETQVRSHVQVALHMDSGVDPASTGYGTDSIVRVNGNPVTFDGDTRWGEADTQENGKVVLSLVTNDKGTAEVTIDESPSRIQRAGWYIGHRTPDLPSLPFWIIKPVGTWLQASVATTPATTTPTTEVTA